MADVSAIIVNYNTGAYTANLVDCLRAEARSRGQGNAGWLETLVVENDSPTDQEAWLGPLEATDGVRVVRAPSNLGYGGGCNLGGREARGRNLLFLNPDVFLVPGSVELLSRYLDEHPDVGQVGPRGWYDCHRFFYLPRIELPTLNLHLQEAWRRTSRRRAADFARRRTRHALRIWAATQPQEEPVLAGFAFMMPADLARRLGPFDETFPLYYEDSDLTRRVREAGFRCMLVPDSEVVHLYNKSAGQFEEEAMRKQELSQQRYFEKHYGVLGGWLARCTRRWLQSRGARTDAHAFSAPVDLGEVEAPPELPLSRPCTRYVAEFTVDPLYTLAVGRVDDRPVFTIPTGVWEHFDAMRYYVRFLEFPGLAEVGSYSFCKTAPPRPVASHEEFLERLEQSVLPSELDP